MSHATGWPPEWDARNFNEATMGTVTAYISSTVTDVEECPDCNHQSLAVIDATLIIASGVGNTHTFRRCVECAPCDTEQHPQTPDAAPWSG